MGTRRTYKNLTLKVVSCDRSNGRELEATLLDAENVREKAFKASIKIKIKDKAKKPLLW